MAVIALIAGAFLPWVRSGGSTRNSFTTVRTARTLDLLGNSWATSALGAWFFVPMLGAVILLVLVLRRDRVAAALASVVVLAALAFGLVLVVAGVDIGVGVGVTIVASGATVVAAVWLLWANWSPRSTRELGPSER